MRSICPVFGLLLFTLLPVGRVMAGEREAAIAALPERPLWTQSRLVGYPDPPSPWTVEPAYPALDVKQPLAVGRFPVGDLMWIVSHPGGYGGPGRVELFRDVDDVSETKVLLERPEIIYGLAFHPRFAENGYLYVGCNGRSEALEKKATRVLRFIVSRDPPYRCDADAPVLIIEWPSNGHNGGDLAFGPDGMLYVSSGDGTSDSDPKEAGQDLSTLTGAILRIDVDRPDQGRPYSVPTDNPFVGMPDARPEIWAYGLRNPWRITWDHESHQLWAGNNGQDLWETAHLVRRGENYGWSVMEGSHPFQLHRQRGPTPLVAPTLEHPHSEARSLTGGVVYRGEAFSDLDGAYVYGDYSTGNIWGARHDGRELTWHAHLARTTLQIAGFGVNTRGDLLVVDHGGGLSRLVRRTPSARQPAFPRRLSETGLFRSTARHEVDAGLIPYAVNAPLWSDGAAKSRFIGLPPDGRITFRSSGAWDLPGGTVLVKTFWLPLDRGNDTANAPIETRLLVRQDGEWFGYSYAWNEEHSDATLVEAQGRSRTVLTRHDGDEVGERQTWRYPSRSECMVCHSRAAGFVLGLNTAQMNRLQEYGGSSVNQLQALHHWDLFEEPAPDDTSPAGEADFDLPLPVDRLPRLTMPHDTSQPLEDRVRAYLHANCANCHVHAGGGNSLMLLDVGNDLEKMRVVEIPPQHDRFGIENARIVAPGDPDRSILLHRMSIRGRGQMPPLASERIDQDAVHLIRQWIASLPPAS